MVAEPNGRPGTAAIGVTIAVAGAATHIDRAGVPVTVERLAAELRREVIDVAVGSLDALLTVATLERMVALIWFPADIDTPACDRIVTWADDRRPRPGLIAWAPAGEPMCTETALAAGFDDALVGAVSPRELAARIRAVHRRVHWQGRPHGRLRFGNMTLDVDGHELWIDGTSISLTGTEMSVLRALIRAGGRALTRTDLLDLAWGSANFEISERAVDNVVLRLRRKLPKPDLIQTVRGVGFRLSAEE
jgi:DNA-binding response OmpR family regulator